MRLPIHMLINDLATKLKIRTWYPGNDGFGGEWEIDPEKYEAIRKFRDDAYQDGYADGKTAERCNCGAGPHLKSCSLKRHEASR